MAATVAVEWQTDEKADGQSAAAYRRTVAQLAEAPGALAAANRRPAASGAGGGGGSQWYRAIRAGLALSSGVMVSADGLLVTLGRAPGEGRYNVLLDDGRSLPARIVVDDRRNGLRLLKIDAHDLPHVSLAETEADVGDQVFATFCSDRRERTVAQGIIAGRRGATGASSLQLDLTTGPMSTGGAVIDVDGRLVGIIAGQGGENM
jgi:S1-C subfamily serine protease